MSDLILSTCRGTSCPECGRAAPSWGGLLPSLCGCRVCCSGCFSAHERKLLTEALRQRDERTGDALGLLNRAMSAEEERDATIRAVEEQRHPCPCGRDTAGIKWARCYSCRQAEAEEMEALRGERDAAANLLAVIHRDGGHHTSEVGFVKSCTDAEGRWLELLERAGK